MKTSEPPVIVEQDFNVSKRKVWKALTDLTQMQQWFFSNIQDFEPKVGFTTEFTIKSEERVFPHHWKVLEVIPARKMVQEWKYGGYKGLCTVAFELEEVKQSTKLRVTATVLEDFTDNIPEFKRESCVAGWEYFINKSLLDYINSFPT